MSLLMLLLPTLVVALGYVLPESRPAHTAKPVRRRDLCEECRQGAGGESRQGGGGECCQGAGGDRQPVCDRFVEARYHRRSYDFCFQCDDALRRKAAV